MLSNKRLLFVLFLILTFFMISDAYVQKKALQIDEYIRWRTIRSTSISDNGNWVSYGYRTGSKNDTLYIKSLVSKTLYVIPRGASPKFSDDEKWVAFYVNTIAKKVGKLKKNKKPVMPKVVLMNLSNGKKFSFDNGSSFEFSNGSKFLAVKMIKSDIKTKRRGNDLLLRDLTSGLNLHIDNVSQFSFNKPGSILAYTVAKADPVGNGIFIMNLSTGKTRPLDRDIKIYAKMAWDREGSALTVLKGTVRKGFLQRDNVLLAFTGLNKKKPFRFEYSPMSDPAFHEKMVISEMGRLSWSRDLNVIFFGTKELEKKPGKKKSTEPVADVEIWHWKDDLIRSRQVIQSRRERYFTYRSAFSLTQKRFIRLADKNMRYITLSEDEKWGIGQNRMPYISDWKPRKADYYRVNTATGERKLILKGLERIRGLSIGRTILSPDSKHFLYWKDRQVWDYEMETEIKTQLTRNSSVNFENIDFGGYPGEKTSYGITGWTKDGKAVILSHKYDLWLQPLNGKKAKNLTRGFGTKNEIRLRYVKTNPDDRYIDLAKPILLSAFGQWTKKEGFFKLFKGKLTKLVYKDKSFSRLIKAGKTDKYLYTIQTFANFPDYYVSDGSFSNPLRITDANPWQSEYKWGYRILFDFKNKSGVRLQGTLAIPERYQKGQKLPMHVNFYEKESQNLHNYAAPGHSGYPNFAGMVSNGYLVMQPDIHFNTRTTNEDMLECVEAAVKKVIEMGYADPRRISLHGHSFSGQGSAFISTRSKMFAAIVYGAGITNLISDFNRLNRYNGTNQHMYYIFGQGRIGTNPFDDLELYIRQSAVLNAPNVSTPLLIMHGKKDRRIEWLQAIEFYNALRFSGKNVILLSYPGEGHFLQKLKNQIDFQKRTRSFLDHYLKDKKAPDWMVSGDPFNND